MNEKKKKIGSHLGHRVGKLVDEMVNGYKTK